MSKLTVCAGYKITDFILRYEENDEDISAYSVCKNLPEAKLELSMLLLRLSSELEDLKLKDIK